MSTKMSPTNPCDVSLNYFSATLGQAAQRPRTAFTTVNELIDRQAQKHRDRFACGFPTPHPAQGGTSSIITFGQLYHASLLAAAEFELLLSNQGRKKHSQCVALLCPSSNAFLWTWLGLMRAGCAVLLIAPQCEPGAIAHLCKSCDATLLVHDDTLSDLASAAQACSDKLRISQIPWQNSAVNIKHSIFGLRFLTAKGNDIAYIHHTSGTSSGLPKPISQTHHGGVGVLPSFDGSNAATFTTTPLYHGGVADCFRAWTSGAMIWLFPGDECPITTKNILSCIDATGREVDRRSVPPVKYFSSVPYVLQMLAEDRAGVEMLQKMDIVGVGGAALPPQVGDDLVNQGVRLVSRFGSAECGFLLSSDRNFEDDKDWQYLRLPPHSDNLFHFEQYQGEERLSELIVLPQWPHMAKRNRPDGSFATSDLFERHPTISNAWKYHSRSDSQITLLTGKKFDPAPIEDDIASKSHLVREVLVIGERQQVPRALIFLAGTNTSVDDEIWNIVQAVNQKGQNHTRIPKERIKILADAPPLGRSSKGTLLRASANQRFAREIEEVYADSEADTDLKIDIRDEDEQSVRDIVDEYLTSPLPDEYADFYTCGVDSATCTQLRSVLQNKLLGDGKTLPRNVMYDCGNIERLSQYITNVRRGKQNKIDADSKYMLDLVQRYSDIRDDSTLEHGYALQIKQSAAKVVLLTGATGALGAHILDVLRQNTLVLRIICLVRAPDRTRAYKRVLESLIKRGRNIELDDDIQCVPAELGKQSFGLDEETISMFRGKVTHIIHAAWSVNFSLPLRSLEDDNITGLHNLMCLVKSCENPAQLVFCSSTASVLGKARSKPIPETISSDPSDADRLDYSQSKWVGERICAAASRAGMRGRIKVLRIGQLTGDTANGVWNMTEAWPMMLSTLEAVECLPKREDKLSWLPLDIAAQAVVEISLEQTESQTRDETCQVFHIVNNSTESSWEDLLSWIREVRSTPFDVVEQSIWAGKVENLKSHPAKNLLWLWAEDRTKRKEGEESSGPFFDTANSEQRSEAMRSVKPVDTELVQKIWRWVESELP